MTFNIERKPLGKDNHRKEKRTLRIEKFVEGEWVTMALLMAEDEWRGVVTAKALGGRVRMMRGGKVVAEWGG